VPVSCTMSPINKQVRLSPSTAGSEQRTLGYVEHLACLQHALEVRHRGKARVVLQVGILHVHLPTRRSSMRRRMMVLSDDRHEQESSTHLRGVLSGEVCVGVERSLMARMVDAQQLAPHDLREAVVIRILVERAHRPLSIRHTARAVRLRFLELPPRHHHRYMVALTPSLWALPEGRAKRECHSSRLCMACHATRTDEDHSTSIRP
jgi:hypothetical protein